MQIELSLDDLKTIDEALWAHLQGTSDLGKRINDMVVEQEELAGMDFDDCAGGACKL